MSFRYLIRRLVLSVPIFIGITMLVYFLASFAQESPLYAFMSDPRITEEELARKAIELGLDKPVYIQYIAWFKKIYCWGISDTHTMAKSL